MKKPLYKASLPHLKGIMRKRKNNGTYWWFTASKYNVDLTNELLKDMAHQYEYQHRIIRILTALLIIFAPIFAILEIYDVFQIISLITKAANF